MTTVLVTHGLTKAYGRKRVVNGLNMTVQRSDIYGFLGPNGAGKTTTLRMVVGLIQPTAGQIELLGQNPARAGRSIMAAVGSLIEGPGFYPHLSAAENLRLVQRLKGLRDKTEVPRLLELVDLQTTGRQPVGRFSLGMKQRLGIAMALLGHPRLLVLDEPTNGLDPEGFRAVRSLLRRVVAELDTTVLLSSHLLYEVEQVATRIGVIHDGRLLAESTVEELRHQSERSLEVDVSHPEQATTLIQERLHLPVERRNGVTLVVRGGGKPAALNELLVRNDIQVARLVEQEPSLESIFLNLTGGHTDVESA